MNANQIAADLRAEVLAVENPKVPALRQIRRAFSKKLQGGDPSVVFAVAQQLLSHNDLPKWIAFELVHFHADALGKLNARSLKQLGAGLSAWDQVDPFACYLSGVAWRKGQVSDATVHRWARSSDRWWRRVAVVSTIPLNCTARGGTVDTDRTLAVAELVKSDRDDMVVKAVSWALRELAVKDPEAARDYVAANEAELAKRVIREVRNKLDTGRKNPRSTR